jgi:diguanylate cyclase (GGDEF)-like protein/PAS domain S-box-containing protein
MQSIDPSVPTLRRFTIRLVAAIAALLAGLCLGAALLLQISHRAFRERAEVASQNLVNTIALTIAAEIRQVDNTLVSTRRQLGALHDVGGVDAGRAADIAASERSLLPQVDALRFTDAQGIVMNAEGSAHVSVRDRDYFSQAMHDLEHLTISEPLRGRVIQKWGVVLARARVNEKGAFDGIVYSNLSTEHLTTLLDDASIGSRGAVSLRSASLRLIARYSAGASQPAQVGSANVSDALKSALAANRDRGAFVSVTAIDGVERANAYARVPGYPLIVIAGLASVDFNAPWRHEVAEVAALAILLAVVSVGLGAVVYRQQRGQLLSTMKVEQLVADQHAMLDNELVGMIRLRRRHEVWHNRALLRVFGYASHEIDGQPSRMLYLDEDSYERVGDAYSGLERGAQYRAQLRMRHKDGHALWIDLSGVQLSEGSSLWMMVDISAVKELELQARHLAAHDSLTGLANRAQLDDGIRRAFARARRRKQILAVCYLDLVGFKAINDTFGHQAGDRLLQEVADRLIECVRQDDMVARLGGDEFALVLVVDESDEVERVAERILQSLARPFEASSEWCVGASIGIVLAPVEAVDPDDLLRRADAAMYEAKRAGKNRFVIGASPG